MNELGLFEASQKLQSGELSSVDLVKGLIQQYDRVEANIQGFSQLDKDLALKQAQDSDKRREEGKTYGVYDGVPITLKDNIVVKGQEARCGSSILNGLENVYDAFVVEKMRAAGVVLFGHANMDEFAMGSSSQTSQIKKTSNPHNLDCVPGGSSGGSAAVVASNQALAALGSDTGGSIRQPAAFCGVVGMKPSYGRVSRRGLIAFASSLDQIGPITKDVRDSAFLYDLLSGNDPKDSTSIQDEAPTTFDKLGDVDFSNLTVGVPKEYLAQEGVQNEIKKNTLETIEKLKSLGATIKKISLPHAKYCIPTYYILATAEASTNLACFDGMRYGNRKTPTTEEVKESEFSEMVLTYTKTRSEGFGEEVKRRLLLGTFVLSSGYADQYYKQALKMRKLIQKDFDDAFTGCDIIVTPTTPTTAFRKDNKMSPTQMYLSDIFTVGVNIAGICGLSLPTAYDKENLPIGMQFIANFKEEEKLFKFAYAYEQALALDKKINN